MDVEQPIINKVFHESLHFGKQGLEILLRLVILDRLKNSWFQLLPGYRLIRARSRLVLRLERLLLRLVICQIAGLHAAGATISASWIVCRSRIASGYIIIYPIAILVPRFSCVIRVFSFFLVQMPRIILVLVCLCPCNGNLTVRFRSIPDCIGILIIPIRLLGPLLLLQFGSLRVHFKELLIQLLQSLFIVNLMKFIRLMLLLIFQFIYFRLTICLLLHQCLNFRLQIPRLLLRLIISSQNLIG